MRLPAINAAQLLPRDVSVLAKLFPVLRRVEAISNAPQRERVPLDQKEVRLKAFASLRELLGRISDRAKLVLAIDDLQWGDLDGVELLTNLLCPPDQPAMLLIVSYRSESEDDRIIASLKNAPQIQMEGVSMRHIDLSPLDALEAKKLALSFAKDSTSDAACFAEAVARESGGNPYFVDALARQWHSHGEVGSPSHLSTNVSLNDVVWKWVNSLATTNRLLVEIVSVAGHPLREVELLEVSPNHRDVRDALRGLCTDRLLKTSSHSKGDESFEIFHDRIREAVVAHLSKDRVAECHRVIAIALEASGTADPATIAAHLVGARECQNACAYYLRAADQAASAFAFDLAAKYYQLVMELSRVEDDQFSLRHKLADALANAGWNADAAKEYLILADISSGEQAKF